MKKIVLFFLIILLQNLHAQTRLTEIEKSTALCHVWGILKYYHPEVSRGKYDWNKEFITMYQIVEPVETQTQLNQVLLNWVNSFNNKTTKYLTDTKSNLDSLFAKNSDFKWIENSNFDTNLTSKLNQLRENSNIGEFYASIDKLNNFLNFENEKGFENFDFKIKSNRVLFFASFWNAMRYWNVNIYLTDEPWDQVLINMQSDFMNADTEEKFQFAKMKLFSKLNDSHSDYETDYFLKNIFNRFPPFGGKIVNDSLVVTNLYNKTLAKKNDIQLKDVIYEIENKSVKEYFTDKFKEFGSTSNLNYSRYKNQYYWLLASNKDSIFVRTISKDHHVKSKFIKLYKFEQYPKEEQESIIETKKESFYEINNVIGYLNLDKITKEELSKAFKTYSNKKGIIIDLRNYPVNINESDISKYLFPERKVFVKILAPIKPSYGKYDMQAPLKVIKNPFSTSAGNSNYYKGKIILLVNRKTLSKAEYMGMAIQMSPSCITIGEQTGGAVMNRIEFTLADKTTIDFTGMGAFYPNNIGVQRKGLKIDYEIPESAIDYNANKYLEVAIKLIEQ